VLIELGWALREPGYERVIAVFNRAEGWRAEDLPFDIRQRRAMSYELPVGADRKTGEKVRRRLVRDLADAIRLNLGEHIEAAAATREFQMTAAKEGDASVWRTFGPQLTHTASLGGAGTTTIALVGGPRSYIRVIPAGWKRGIPSINEIAQGPAVWPPSEHGDSGDFGPWEQGFIRYWITGRSGDGLPESANVTSFLDETGEIWMIHGTVIVPGKAWSTIHPGRLLGAWSKALRQTFALFDRFEALEARRVEVGLTRMKGVRWMGQGSWDSPPARRDDFALVQQRRDWGNQAQHGFLTEAYSGVKNLFGLARASDEEVKEILACWDRDRPA
jgi:hypothetical protein